MIKNASGILKKVLTILIHVCYYCVEKKKKAPFSPQPLGEGLHKKYSPKYFLRDEEVHCTSFFIKDGLD